MKMIKILLPLTFIPFLSCMVSAQKQAAVVDPGIWVRKGYTLSLVQSEIQNPRFLQMSDDGTLFVSLPETGVIKACRDANNDGYYETTTDFIKGHKTVQGMCWRDGWLWFTESGAIFKARSKNNNGVADEIITVIKKGDLPSGGGHWWRSIQIHKDRIYTSIGCSGNIDDETNTERLKIWSFALDGTDKKLFCGGLRNTEKLVVRPGTDEIWGMDHGSDMLGGVMEKKKDPFIGQPITDLNPPDEMNHYVQDGFYGHPYITGNKLPRYEYMDRPDIVEWANKTIPPAWATGAHWAPNAMTFYDANLFPSAKGDAFVAYHGSWNRSVRSGYQVTRVLFEDGKPYGELPYVKFLAADNDKFYGRPSDVIVAKDGSLLISDDWGGKIYKLTYTGK